MKRQSTVLLIFVLILVSSRCLQGEGGVQSRGGAAYSGREVRETGSSSSRSRITYTVEVEPVQVRSLIYTVNAVGSIEAFEKVQVTARVAGIVDRVLFAEGNYAKLDQILVEIEPERYKLAVEAAQAAYEKAEASKADAEAGLKRREDVANQTPGPDSRRRTRDLANQSPSGGFRCRSGQGGPESGESQSPRRLCQGAVFGDHPDSDGPDGSIRPGRNGPGHSDPARPAPSPLSESRNGMPPGSSPGLTANFEMRDNRPRNIRPRSSTSTPRPMSRSRMVAMTAEIRDTQRPSASAWSLR